MFIVTLLVDPKSPTLDPALVENLRNAWGGGDAIWLAPDEAAEFDVAVQPDTFETTHNDLLAMGIDLAIQPEQGRKKSLLLADMDSTMIGQECIDELAAEAGFGERVAAITARAMNGELDFEAALIERVSLLKGLDLSVIDQVLEHRISMAPGGATLVATTKSQGGHAALVSGGFTAFTEVVATKLGFDEHRANTLLHDDGKLTGDVARPILGRDAKVAALTDICARLGISTDQAMAVGDGANDLGMLDAAGAGVALHAKSIVAEQAAIRIDHGDLTALLYLQGYAKSEFQEVA